MGAGVSPNPYRPLKTGAAWIGRTVRARVPLQTGLGLFPAGTVYTVTGIGGGLALRGDPCGCCGVAPYIRKVPVSDVHLIPEGPEGAAHLTDTELTGQGVTLNGRGVRLRCVERRTPPEGREGAVLHFERTFTDEPDGANFGMWTKGEAWDVTVSRVGGGFAVALRSPLPDGELSPGELHRRALYLDGARVWYTGKFLRGLGGLFSFAYLPDGESGEAAECESAVYGLTVRADGGLDLSTSGKALST